MNKLFIQAMEFVGGPDEVEPVASRVLTTGSSFFNALAPALPTFASVLFSEKFLDLSLRSPTFKWAPTISLFGPIPTDKIVLCIRQMRYCKGIWLEDTSVDPDVIVDIIVHSPTLEKFCVTSKLSSSSGYFRAAHLLAILQQSRCESVRQIALSHLFLYTWNDKWDHPSRHWQFGEDLIELNALQYLNEHILAAKRVRGEVAWFSFAACAAAGIFRHLCSQLQLRAPSSLSRHLPTEKSIKKLDIRTVRTTFIDHLPFLLQYGVDEIAKGGLEIMRHVLGASDTAPQLVRVLKLESTAIEIGVAIFEEKSVNAAAAAVSSTSTTWARFSETGMTSAELGLLFIESLCRSPAEVEQLLQHRVFPALLALQPAFNRLLIDGMLVSNNNSIIENSSDHSSYFNTWTHLSSSIQLIGRLLSSLLHPAPTPTATITNLRCCANTATTVFAPMVRQGTVALEQLAACCVDETARNTRPRRRLLVRIIEESLTTCEIFLRPFRWDDNNSSNTSLLLCSTSEQRREISLVVGRALRESKVVNFLFAVMQQVTSDAMRVRREAAANEGRRDVWETYLWEQDALVWFISIFSIPLKFLSFFCEHDNIAGVAETNRIMSLDDWAVLREFVPDKRWVGLKSLSL